MVAEPLCYTPASSWLRVRLTAAAERSAGGIILPELARKRPCEGTVLAAGPGRRIPNSDLRTVVWASPGDIVVFSLADFQPGGAGDREGLVRAESVVGIVHPETDEVMPEEAWVKIEPDEADRMSEGGIHLPERSRKQARHGLILEAGPGETILTGAYFGSRRPTRAIMSLKAGEELLGRTAYWGEDAKVLHLGGRWPCVLVRASDIIALEA